jgi:hypothetical protein
LQRGAIMKQCPKCHKSWPDDSTYCRSCGYYFPFPKMSNDTEPGFSPKWVTPDWVSPTERDGSPIQGCLFLILWGVITASILLSGLMVYISIVAIEEAREYGGSDGQVLVWLCIALLLGGANLYTLITTKGWSRWKHLPQEIRTIAEITIVADVIGLGLYGFLCWLGMQMAGP